MKTALRFVHSLCVLPLLTGCGASKPPLVRTELIEWPVLVYAQLPAAYTDPITAPLPPPADCTLPDGRKVPCVLDSLLRDEQWQTLLRLINEDRASAGRLSGQVAPSIGGLKHRDGTP
ncbi:hypothetical protein [Xanthomonas citri]|uniref:hypothetical protein n=1 Tax=Xanthomonas citri TaxID=346 RepID=UPI0012FD5730|nr:hypothetical protein [Xanthomonas citri]